MAARTSHTHHLFAASPLHLLILLFTFTLLLFCPSSIVSNIVSSHVLVFNPASLTQSGFHSFVLLLWNSHPSPVSIENNNRAKLFTERTRFVSHLEPELPALWGSLSFSLLLLSPPTNPTLLSRKKTRAFYPKQRDSFFSLLLVTSHFSCLPSLFLKIVTAGEASELSYASW